MLQNIDTKKLKLLAQASKGIAQTLSLIHI